MTRKFRLKQMECALFMRRYKPAQGAIEKGLPIIFGALFRLSTYGTKHALHAAMAKDYLLKNRDLIHYRDPILRRTALHYAALLNQCELSSLLLQLGATRGAADKEGNTARDLTTCLQIMYLLDPVPSDIRSNSVAEGQFVSRKVVHAIKARRSQSKLRRRALIPISWTVAMESEQCTSAGRALRHRTN